MKNYLKIIFISIDQLNVWSKNFILSCLALNLAFNYFRLYAF